ncbi:MAG TPA: pyridoxal 5'-phosphate synthase glutaminase subunit PdxT [Peptococcaceae bacterium]|nr:pyridoxal 5'-phosphate synthase glutaminase subunit PdxT [Peptococcaceae bacterium]
MKIGVLALQGAFREHSIMLDKLGASSTEVRKPEHLEGIDALVIPGGESTTIGKLMAEYGLLEPIREMGQKGLPILGTCAGMVLLADKIKGSDQPRIGLLEMEVVRNGFGRQVDSFEEELKIKALGEAPFRAVFIRAPYVERVGSSVEVLAAYGDRIVMVKKGKILACAFHPELTDDPRVHKYFLEIIETP